MEITAPELTTDDKLDRGFVTWYNGLEKVPQLVRFFDRKDYYSIHGENAIYIAKTFYKTLAVVKYIGGSNGLPGVALNQSLFETVLQALLLNGGEHMVEMYEGSGSRWSIARRASPGKLTAFEDELFRNNENTEAPVIVAVTLARPDNSRTLGVAYCNVTTRKLGACEFVDSEQYCTLESILLQLGAKEVVMPKDTASGGSPSSEFARISNVVSRCNAMVAERPKASFGVKNLEQDLPRLLQSGNIEHHRDILDRPTASSALAGVLAFSEVSADSSNFGKFQLSIYNTDRYLRMDSAAQRALNVMPTKLDANDKFSLFGLMNRGKSAMGRRLLKVWLKQPLTSSKDIEVRHDVVEAFVQDPELRERLRDQHLRGAPDVEMLTRKLEKGKASLADLCQLYRASSKLPGIILSLKDHTGSHAALLASRYAEVLETMHDGEHLSKYEDLLEAAIDLDRIPDEYLIAPTYDSGLEELRSAKDKVEVRINDIAEDVASDLGLQMDKSIRLEWYKVANTRTRCLRLTQTEEKKVRSKLQSMKYTMLETRKDGTKFTNKALKEAAQELQSISRDYANKQQQLVEEVMSVAQTFCEVWETVGGLLAELDLLAAFADLAVNAPTSYVRPKMLAPDSGRIELIGSRHPCIEAQAEVEFIKNDCSLVQGKSWFQIITGPNMGGKSTYIRQVGMIVLMAQVGAFVPCDKAEIAVRDCIFARVGAGDCQVRGVSTFMAEMLETAAILKGASSNSLVIIDELGRGTSTYDGFGLAWAISEHLMEQIGCPTLFATHFHELTALKGSVGVANCHVTTAIDEASSRLTMLYEVLPGACDESFGIHVARFAQFPAEVVELAERNVAKLEGFHKAGALENKGIKRKRSQEEEDGAAIARAFLEQFVNLPVEDLSSKAQELYKGLEDKAADNPYLASLLVES